MKLLRVIKPRPRWNIAFSPALMLLISVGAGWALFASTRPWPVTPDGTFHLQRVRALAEAWSMGTLYPRWFPDFAFGYGHPILHYYAPLSYVAPALLHTAGLDVVTATRLSLALLYAASSWAAYWAVRPWLTHGGALTVALLYLVFPYRLYDLFIRGALPEFAAFFWLPLLLGLLLRLILAPNLDHTRLCLAGLAWAGLALTHNLTLLMLAILAVAAVPLIPLLLPPRFTVIQVNGIQMTEKIPYWSRLGMVAARSALAAGLGALLSAFYTLPALLDAPWVGIGATPSSQGYLNHFAGWRDLIQWRFLYAYPGAAHPTVPLPASWLTLVIAGLLLLVMGTRRTKQRLALPFAGLIMTLWLTTGWSVDVWHLADPVLGKLQFPWRWQTAAALPFALVGGLAVDAAGRAQRSWVQIALTLLIGVSSAWIALPRSLERADPTVTRPEMWAFDAANGQIGATWAGEFLPRWVQAPRWAIGQAATDAAAPIPAVSDPDAPLHVTALQQGYLESTFRIAATESLTLTFDQFYFPGWQVTVDGIPHPAMPRGELGLLSADLPGRIHRLAITWAPTPAVWIGRGLSTLGWLWLALLLWQTQRIWALSLWGLVGLTAVVGIAGLAERAIVPTTVPTTVAADYGSMELAAAEAVPAAPGALATIRLYWLLRAAQTELADSVVFVHIVRADDPANTVVAQWDEPVGGPYHPPSRWQPPQLLRQSVHVPLPPDLPPGDYRVLGGIYRAGAPEAPLLAEGKNEARLPLTTLRVEE